MKKLLLLVAAIGCVAFTGCSKDDDESNNLKEQIIGTWDATAVQFSSDNNWLDVTNYPNLALSISFYDDNTYHSRGALGSGDGTYKIQGKTVATYIDGDLIATYEIKSISNTNIEVLMTMNGETLGIRGKKR